MDSYSLSDSGNGGNGGAINLSATNDINIAGNILSYSYSNNVGNAGNGGAINLTAANGSITTGGLDSSSSSIFGNAENGGAISLSAANDINIAGDSYFYITGSYSSSKFGNAGNGGAISLIARSGNISAQGQRNPSTVVGSFSISEQGTAGNGGNVALAAKNQVSNLEILTLSSSSQSGKVQVTGRGDLLLTNTNILTSKQVRLRDPFSRNNYITLNVGGKGQSGNVDVTSSGNLTFDNSSIQSDTKGRDPAGNVSLTSPGLVMFNNSQIVSNTSNIGKAGDIAINAGQGITFQGLYSYQNLPQRGGLFAGTTNEGNAGNITLTTPELTLQNGAEIATTTGNLGAAGNINLQSHPNGENLTINLEQDTSISASTSNQGTGGHLTITAPNAITIQGEGTITTETAGAGQAGDILVNTPQFTLKDGVELSAAAAKDSGNAGEISLNTQQLTLDNNAQILASNVSSRSEGIIIEGLDTLTLNNNSDILASTETGEAGSLRINANSNPANSVQVSNNSRLSVEATEKGGNAGGVRINTQHLTLTERSQLSASNISGVSEDITLEALDTLSVNNSLISASTQRGKAGSLTINATESVDLKGAGGLSVEATQGGTAGNLSVETGRISIRDGAAVTVSSPSGIAGNLNITAHSLFLNRGTLNAETGKSSLQGGANITIKGLDFLWLENESLISASAFNAASGGNINIDTTFLIALPPVGPNGSDIIANAQQGAGGKIDINAAGIFGIEERRAIPGNRTNDIDASSEFGSAGQVTLSTLINPSQGLSQLPTQLVDPTRQIDSSCAAKGDNESKFTVTGRGGLPSTPSDLLTSDQVLDDFGTLATAKPTASEPVKPASSSPHKQLVEAQGWIITADGTVILTALAPSVTPHSSPLTPASCQHTQK